MSERYILLAEDNKNDVLLTQRALKKCGIDIGLAVVSHGQEALDFLFSQGKYQDMNDRPALMLLDVKLPLIDGLEVLRQVRADERTRLLPVVVLSCSVDEKDRKESLRLGANAYHSKPVSFDEFVELMRRIHSDWLLD
jgi:two-component system, response regulator